MSPDRLIDPATPVLYVGLRIGKPLPEMIGLSEDAAGHDSEAGLRRQESIKSRIVFDDMAGGHAVVPGGTVHLSAIFAHRSLVQKRAGCRL